MSKNLALNIPMTTLLNVGAGNTNSVRLQYIGDPTQGQIVINNASPYAFSTTTECPFTLTQDGDSIVSHMSQGFTAVSVPLNDPTSVGWTIEASPAPTNTAQSCTPYGQQSKPAYTSTAFQCGSYADAVVGEVSGCLLNAMIKGESVPDDCGCLDASTPCPQSCKPTILQYCGDIYNTPGNKAIIDSAWGWTSSE